MAGAVVCSREFFLQRLFSTFANGWPGMGLLLMRLIAGVAIIHDGLLPGVPHFSRILRQILEAGAGTLFLLGLWTPVTGALVGIISVWGAFSASGDSWTLGLLAVMGAGLAMVGPGAWSIDARLFGRKQIDVRRTRRSQGALKG